MSEQKENIENISYEEDAPRVKKRPSIVLIIICITIGLLAVAFIIPMYSDYTYRTRIAEGLVLASGAKNLVVDNAANGFHFNQGWDSPEPTKNTQAILIDRRTGVVYIISNPKSTGGGVVLALIPMEDGEQLVPGKQSQGRISWECKTLSLGSRTMHDIPSECKTLMSSTL